MKVSRKKFKKRRELRKYDRKNYKMLRRKWGGIFFLKRKKIGRKDINILLWDWLNNFKKFGYVGKLFNILFKQHWVHITQGENFLKKILKK